MINYFKNIEYVDSISSTNKELKKEKYNIYPSYVLIANHQTSGSGRMGRSFVSNKDAGLYMSIRIKPNIEIDKLQNITCVIASITLKAIENQINTKCFIKWVNDIYLNGLKVAGILVESKLNTQKKIFDYLVIGIGINLYNQDFDALSNIATSIEKETKIKINKELLTQDILKMLEEYLKDFDSVRLMDLYISRSYLKGKQVKLQLSNNIIECKVLDINHEGELIIKHQNEVKNVTSAEVIKVYL